MGNENFYHGKITKRHKNVLRGKRDSARRKMFVVCFFGFLPPNPKKNPSCNPPNIIYIPPPRSGLNYFVGHIWEGLCKCTIKMQMAHKIPQDPGIHFCLKELEFLSRKLE